MTLDAAWRTLWPLLTGAPAWPSSGVQDIDYNKLLISKTKFNFFSHLCRPHLEPPGAFCPVSYSTEVRVGVPGRKGGKLAAQSSVIFRTSYTETGSLFLGPCWHEHAEIGSWIIQELPAGFSQIVFPQLSLLIAARIITELPEGETVGESSSLAYVSNV